MVHAKQHISDLAEIFYQLGVAYVVISPGSRNSPLINSFLSRFKKHCISIVDERSAAYFGLGLAKESGKTCILICTSGTASLNYAPALAEAYYQQIPLIALTADRPAEWIDQQDNQTIRQQNIYQNFIKASFELPLQAQTQNELELVHRIAITAYRQANQSCSGPVHINIPLAEPLYDTLPNASLFSIEPELQAFSDVNNEADNLLVDWKNAESILIVQGQNPPDEILSSALKTITGDKRTLLVAENISNVVMPDCVSEPDLLFAHNGTSKLPQPGLVIYAGGQVVSKKLKSYLRSLENTKFWRIGQDAFPIDTYKQNNSILHQEGAIVFEMLARNISRTTRDKFRESWFLAKQRAEEKRRQMIENSIFSDLTAMNTLLNTVPGNSILELGNSSSIRYSQLFNSRSDVCYYSNRGVSGIDGCLSTAAGSAFSSDKLTLVIVGDMSLGYDSNALWNKKLTPNLRIAVLSNSGGGIFDLIEGPSDHEGFEEFYLAHHPLDMQKLAEAYNLNYFCCENEKELTELLPKFLGELKNAAILEIKTKRVNNTNAFFDLMNRKRKSKKH